MKRSEVFLVFCCNFFNCWKTSIISLKWSDLIVGPGKLVKEGHLNVIQRLKEVSEDPQVDETMIEIKSWRLKLRYFHVGYWIELEHP